MHKFLYLFIIFGVIFLTFSLPNDPSQLYNEQKLSYNSNKNGISKSKCENYIKQACDKKWIPKKKMVEAMIAGGRKAKPKEFPHMALIGGSEVAGMKWLCGGSLISENFVLSAAHCGSKPQVDAKLIRLGDLDYAIEKDDATPMDFLILEKISHPGFKPPAMYHDIALFRFEGLKTFTEYIRPTCLNYLDETPYLKGTATGWGTTSYEGPISTMLLAVDLDVFNITFCDHKIFGDVVPKRFNETIMICAGKLEGGKDTCPGDSGGPLQIKKHNIGCDANIYSQIGVISFGLACGLIDTPVGYTKVSYYVPWIERIVWSNFTSR